MYFLKLVIFYFLKNATAACTSRIQSSHMLAVRQKEKGEGEGGGRRGREEGEEQQQQQSRMTLNFQFSCLHIPGASMHHHVQFI